MHVHRFEAIIVCQSDFTEFSVHNDRPVFGSVFMSKVPLSDNFDRFTSFHRESWELVAASFPGSGVLFVWNLDGVPIFL